ncbi:PREDICTED: CMRF35-like molecule 1 isoform X1 [Bison bison bison]|uniref:CMRF35-like molecule 1 isoform X1 n=2 Tax=Bison bison bison TaxID=43346 RepID=A0A6P3ITD6_BISBB|nr:PREDICTED: CMRF35-like molecule 1 isoform X1 [Bison bison bison]XP_010854425.1 PREDICTED: CMRF35-like molecule 1 isoform X1 [Bison bison bison]
MHLPLLFCLFLRLSGSSAISGPRAVRGVEWGSLTVQCQYDPGYERYVKWWCRGAAWNNCRFVIKTTGSEKEVKKGRVSIRDNWKDRSFTVTMEELRLDDSDTYWCGIERTGTDLGNTVEVTIDPAPTTVPTTPPTTSTVNTKDNIRFSAATGHHSNDSDGLKLSVLLPLIFAVLLLLFMVASLVAWRMAKRPKKASGTSPVQVLQPPGSDICYADLNLQQIEKPSGSSRKKASGRAPSSPQAYSGDGDYANTADVFRDNIPYTPLTPKTSSLQAEVSRDSITYAALSLDTSDEQPTYSNMEHLNNPPPSRILEKSTVYSTIRKP